MHIYIYVCVCVSTSISSVSTYLTYQFCSLENLEGSFITTGLVFSMARGYIMSMWVISDLTICQLIRGSEHPGASLLMSIRVRSALCCLLESGMAGS